MSYKNYKFTAISRDYHSPYLRNHIWVKSFYYYPELLGVPKIAAGMASRDNHIEYLVDMDTWSAAHEVLKEKAVNDYHFVEQLIDSANEHGEKMNRWTEENVYSADLTTKNGQELIDLLKDFGEMQAKEYALGTAVPVLDFQGFSFVENNLNNYLQDHVSGREREEYYAVLTEPAHDSFAQEQEKDLLNLMIKYYHKDNWISDVKNKNLDILKTIYPDFYSDLQKHAAKYAWVYYVYMGPAYTEPSFFEFIQEYVKQGVNPAVKLSDINKHRAKVEEKKMEIISNLKPNEFETAIMNLAGKFVWAKPRRKDYQSKSYYHVEKLMREIAKRLNISLEQARSAPWDLLEQALAGNLKIDSNELNGIKKMHVLLANDDGSISILTGDSAEDFSREFIFRENDEVDTDLQQLNGVCACPGKVKGSVRIINIPEDMFKMNAGDVLVSTATTPSIVSAMKKAAAIITDEGGLTCHASIVSRELQIPCVIGTKVATRVLKDGDMVEVDADRGRVNKLTKQK